MLKTPKRNPTSLPCQIHLQAVSLSRNIARRYTIEAEGDLFGHIIVALYWGRIGTRGQSRIVSFAEPIAAQNFMHAALRKRHSAKKRIGVAYRPCT
jgi:predicted DNA-binding WGR domain protein